MCQCKCGVRGIGIIEMQIASIKKSILPEVGSVEAVAQTLLYQGHIDQGASLEYVRRAVEVKAARLEELGEQRRSTS